MSAPKTVRMSDDQHRRMRVACAEDGLSFAEMLDHLLDLRDQGIAMYVESQLSPLHPPGLAAYADGEAGADTPVPAT